MAETTAKIRRARGWNFDYPALAAFVAGLWHHVIDTQSAAIWRSTVNLPRVSFFALAFFLPPSP
jgi:hypothetical protein